MWVMSGRGVGGGGGDYHLCEVCVCMLVGMCMHVCMCVCLHACMCGHTCMHLCAHMFMCMSLHVFMCTHMFMCMSLYVYVYVSMSTESFSIINFHCNFSFLLIFCSKGGKKLDPNGSNWYIRSIC